MLNLWCAAVEHRAFTSMDNEPHTSCNCEHKPWPIHSKGRLVCKQWLDTDVCICSANAISVYREHPLLLNRSGRQGSLYFSSCPQDPYQIYAYIWEILHHHYKGWLAASRMMPGSPASFHTLLTGGYGLLLRGPISVLTSVRDRIGSDLKTQLIDTHIVETNRNAISSRRICSLPAMPRQPTIAP